MGAQTRYCFATQLGFSKLIKIPNKYLSKLLFKFEYSAAEPQVYVHKFEINNPEHHGYPIGLWSGGDSIDRRLNLILFIKSTLVNMGWNNTRIGEAIYDENQSLLSSLYDCFDEFLVKDNIKKKLSKNKILYNFVAKIKITFFSNYGKSRDIYKPVIFESDKKKISDLDIDKNQSKKILKVFQQMRKN